MERKVGVGGNRGMLAGLAAMMGIGPRVEEVKLPKPGRFSRWIGEVSPGRWRSVWKGSDPYRYCSGAAETRRRRLRIIADQTPPSQVLGSYFEARDLALRTEFPKTHRFAA